RYVGQTVEVQVSVLEPIGEALVGVRPSRGRRTVHLNGPRSLLEAVAVGELAQRAAGRVIGGAGHWTIRPLRGRVLAATGGAWALTDSLRAFRTARASVEDVRVVVGLAVREGGVERVLVGHRVADLRVADFLL